MPRHTLLALALALTACGGGEEELESACTEGMAASLDIAVTGDTTGAATLPQSCGAEGPVDLVSFTAPATGTYSASVSGFDTVLSVWTGCPESLETEIACVDDHASVAANGSAVEFTVGAGATVTLAVGGYQGQAGAYELVVSEGRLGTDPVDPVDPCEIPDQDEDGEDSVACGGLDCDDLDPEVQAGTDVDEDGFFADCGFDVDCDDNDPDVHPFAEEILGDGIDQDCDGGEPFATCEVEGPRTSTQGDTLDCAPADDLQARPYDVWEFSVAQGDCVDVFVDNSAVGRADLLGTVEGADGISFAGGLGPGGFDDVTPCSNTPWNNLSCPAATVASATAGTFRVSVGQFGGLGKDGCSDGAEYTLHVAVNGAEVAATLVEDDVVP
ncbi:MAG: hypothetical protein EP330_22920 [Deltaproteobacteria bacterium]|nr:MAG: hypothetical protein EP330_22920 [Deltaproteobacteria bacterium]